MTKSLLAWHFLAGTHCTGYDENIEVLPGQTLKIKPPIELCSRGYHASVRPIDALQFAPGAIICRVKLHGTVIEDTDKAVATRRTCLWMADATRTLHEFAIWAAEQALDLIRKSGQTVDPRSEMALQVKRLWLDGKATDQELDAAWDAARTAARTAAWDSARDAAWDAAWDSARDSAWAAAWAAARDSARAAARAAAWDAARAAAWTDQNEKLEAMLLALEHSQYAIKAGR